VRDLQQRFEALDLVEAPYQWTDIEQRATRPDPVRTPSWLHGAWVAVATAAAVLVFAGGVVTGRWLLGAGSILEAAFGGSGILHPSTPADVSVLALVVAGAGGGSVLLAAALTLTWKWRKRNGRPPAGRPLPLMETRGGAMETMEMTAERPERTIQEVTRNNRWLILAVVVLFAALAALGAWLLINNFVTTDMEKVVVDSNAALNSGDRTAWIAAYSDDAVLTFVAGGSPSQVSGTQELFAWAQEAGAMDFHAEITGPTSVIGDYVTAPMTTTWRGTVGEVRSEGIMIFRILDGQITESFFLGGRPAS